MSFQVVNKNIDNASGQVVRLDIQNTIKTVANNNFGPRNSAGTILPCEFLADDTTNKLLIRKSSGGDQANPNPTSGTAADFFEIGDLDTANLGLLPKTGGTLTGVLQLPTGSVSAPALTVGDSGTGLFKPSSNVLAVTADGTQKISVNSTATEFFGNATTGAKIRFLEASNNGNSYVELKAADSISNNLLLTLPTADGTSGQALITNGSGTLSFGVPSAAAANLVGNTLANGVTASSLTSLGTLTALTVGGNLTVTGNTSFNGHVQMFGNDIYMGNGTIISNDSDGAFSNRSGSNIDHIWHNDSNTDSNTGWNFVSDGTYKRTGNAAMQAGSIRCYSQDAMMLSNPTDRTINDSDQNDPIHFETVDLEKGGINDSNSKSRITVSQDGIYLITCCLSGSVTTHSHGDGIAICLRKNGSIFPRESAFPVESFGSQDGMEWAFTFAITEILSDNDYLEVVFRNIEGTVSATLNKGYFCVTRLH